MARAKPISKIDCDAPACASISRVLTTRLEEMCALRDAALDWSDPEGVHDMRVASRRLRGALQDFMPYLKKRRLAHCLADIKTLASALGRVRDQDVAIMTLADTAAKAPAEVAAGINRLADSRRATLIEAREKLVLALDPPWLLELQQKFAAALTDDKARGGARQKRSVDPDLTYREVAASIILNRLEELEKSSKSLYTPLRVKPLHDMRITAKHLRYALELFAECWASPLPLLASKVAGLQSSLGKLHDCDIWLEDFGEVANEEAAKPDHESRATLVWLLRHFAKLRARHFGKALSQWHEWETEDFSRRLRECIPEGARTTTRRQ